MPCQFCGFDRKVKTYNETLRTNEYLPLYEAASTKLALMNVAFDQDDFRVDECLDFLCKEKILTLQNWSKIGHLSISG